MNDGLGLATHEMGLPVRERKGTVYHECFKFKLSVYKNTHLLYRLDVINTVQLTWAAPYMTSQATSSVSTQLVNDLDRITTEGRNPDTLTIDTLSALDIVQKINAEDHKVAVAVQSQLPVIAELIEAIVKGIKAGGRLIYLGAGTSGRLGILDAVECRPTFSVPDSLVVGVIAGGERAIQHAVEGAEDNYDAGKQDIADLDITPSDTIVGLSASGRTPYVCGGLDYANHIGCTTAAIACSANARIFESADLNICPVVGPEALTGSTRMKAGTAQKLVLNMLSTAVMIRMGKAYENLMVDVNATNEKLKARALRIVMQATDCSSSDAQTALEAAKYSAKVAILMILTGSNAEIAAASLKDNEGYLRRAIDETP